MPVKDSDFNGPWMRSIEAQIIEGGVGDFIVVAGSDASGTRLTPEVTATVSADRLGQFRSDQYAQIVMSRLVASACAPA